MIQSDVSAPTLRTAAFIALVWAMPVVLLAGCDGENAWRGGVTGPGTSVDAAAPVVHFDASVMPAAVAVPDSVFTSVRVRDNSGIVSVEIEGFALRGDAALGTQVRVSRFIAKTVSFDPAGRLPVDTTITRYLLAAADTLPEALVYLVATARDSVGNVGADTITISIAPRHADVTPPTLEILIPTASERTRRAVGDSIFTAVRVSDNLALESLTLEGFALRGAAQLGTLHRVDRFTAKAVALGTNGIVRDSTIFRYLIATADTLAEDPVYIVATVRDTAGNVAADTVVVSIGGPQVQIVSPLSGAEVRAGTPLIVRVSARERPHRIAAIRVSMEGAVGIQRTLQLSSTESEVDTVVVLNLPGDVSGDGQIHARVFTSSGDSAAALPVNVRVIPTAGDAEPPVVRFSATFPQRVELWDSLQVSVSATDNTLVQEVGLTVRARWRSAQGVPLTSASTITRADTSAIIRFSLESFQIPEARDSATAVELELVAFARDTSGHCAAATSLNMNQSLPCRLAPDGSGIVTADREGALLNILLARGRTVRALEGVGRFADVVSDGSRVFVSNMERNRLEVLPVASTTPQNPVRVGSDPWGLTLSRTVGELLVANSGGTDISVVDIVATTAVETRRIGTADLRLYDVTFSIDSDSATAMVEVDYSDRPQFVGETSSGHIVYSTKPTPARSDGTIRIIHPDRDRRNIFGRGSEIFTRYAEGEFGRAIVVNALEAGYSKGLITVWPRSLHATGADPDPITNVPVVVRDSLQVLATRGLTDTRIDLNRTLASVGLTDTTYVAVSGSRSTVAFGEGATNPGRILRFDVRPGGHLDGTTVQTRDLVGNASERIVGLTLNRDGSLGAARGGRTYFFDGSLRLKGMVTTGLPIGGLTMHPNHGSSSTGAERIAAVSGISPEGPFVDIVDTFHFTRLRRILLATPVTGGMIAVPARSGDDAQLLFRVYAITARGLIEIPVYQADAAS